MVRAGVLLLAWVMLTSTIVLAPATPSLAAAVAAPADGDVCLGELTDEGTPTGAVKVREYDGEWWNRTTDNDIIDAWLGLYPGPPPPPTPAGYRYDVAVCVDAAGQIIGLDFGSYQLVAADDAQEWYNTALNNAIDDLDLKAPGWRTFPDRNFNQVVFVDTWFYVENHWDTKTRSHENGEVRVTVTATPEAVDYRLIPQADGQPEIDFPKCTGRGDIWTEGDRGASSCSAPPWEHSLPILGEVEVRGRTEFKVVITSTTLDNEDANIRGGVTTTSAPIMVWGPWDVDDDTPSGDRYNLRVAEVLSYGVSGEQVIAAPPEAAGPTPGGDTIGVTCGTFDVYCKVIKPIGGVIIDFLIPKEILEALEACADAFSDAFGGIGDLLNMLNPANWDDILSDFNDLRGVLAQAQSEGRLVSVLTDMAVEMGEEALQLNRLRDADGNWDLSSENIASWVGYMACDALIGFISGGAIDKLADFARIARKWKGKRDRGEDTGPNDRDRDGTSCPIGGNSFLAGTLVLMASGRHRAIDEIRPGELVLSYNISTDQWEPRPVMAQWSHPYEGPLATMTLRDGSQLEATAEHLVWESHANAFQSLTSFEPGDTVLSIEGDVPVAYVATSVPAPNVVWDIAVSHNHNFTVSTGNHDILVHNAAPGSCRTEPRHGGDNRDGDSPIDGDTDFDVYDPEPPGDRITDIDEMRDGDFVEHKALDNVPGDPEAWIQKHIREKAAKLRDAAEVLGLEPNIIFELGGEGADASLRAAIEAAAAAEGATVIWKTPLP